MLLPARIRPVRSPVPAILVGAAASCVLATIGLIAAIAARPPAPSCAVPEGYALVKIGTSPATPAPPAPIRIPHKRQFAQPPPPLPVAVEPIAWASHVRGMSTQYDTTSWAATQALGAPDLYPESGDDPRAWASAGEDDRTEYLEVGFAPHRMSALRIYETFNPGAVTSVELTFADGSKRTIDHIARGGTGADAVVRRVDLGGCTGQPVIAARVTLDSKAVAGWNEIDAIGGETCD